MLGSSNVVYMIQYCLFYLNYHHYCYYRISEFLPYTCKIQVLFLNVVFKIIIIIIIIVVVVVVVVVVLIIIFLVSCLPSLSALVWLRSKVKVPWLR